MRTPRRLPTALGLLALTACGPGALDGGEPGATDGGPSDGGSVAIDDAGDVAPIDAGEGADAGDPYDGGSEVIFDGGDGPEDAGGDPDPDPEPFDAGPDEPEDAGVEEPDYVDAIDHAFLIAHFGGTVVDAFEYSDDLAGFQLYLDDVGVQYFSANEITSPNNPSAAHQCGYDILLPEQAGWERIGALALLSDQLRALVDEPVFMRNWWRPPCYNNLVGGAAGGDHPDADAVDLDFSSATSRAAAQAFLCENYWSQDIVAPEEIAPGTDLDPRLNLSVGMGGATLHVGLLSANGRRFWFYGSYTEEPGSGDCW